MLSFSNKSTKRYAGNILNGFNRMASLLSAMPANRGSQNCSVFPPRANSALLPNQRNNSDE